MIPDPEIQQLSQRRWLSTAEFVRYLLAERQTCSLLKTDYIQGILSTLGDQDELQLEALLDQLSEYLHVNELPFNERQISSLSRLSQVAFLSHDKKLLPLECVQDVKSILPPNTHPRVFFLSASLPKQKLSKKQFVNILMNKRWSIIVLALALGSPPVIASTVAELLEQPLFDNFVPEGNISPIILVGIASIVLQLTAQLFSTMQSLAQCYFTQSLDFETKIATAQRYLWAKSSALPQKDIGSWRLTFSVASAFLGSINSLFISIPIALISLLANILLVGGFTDLSAVWNLFLILLIPTAISIVISYLSSSVSIRVMGQQSSVDSTIYDTVRQIRGIWLTNTESLYINRFIRARVEISKSLLRSGSLEATSSVVTGLFQGLLYAFIFYQYYRSYLDPSRSNLSVGSLLVIYSAIGTLSASLASISEDLVSIAQSLPTYWIPNAIRDISSFRKPPPSSFIDPPERIILSDLTYTAPDADYPFSHPISLDLSLNHNYALVGPSGSGKSTLISILIGNLIPKTGSVQLYNDHQQILPNSLTDCRLLVLGQEASACGSCLSDLIDPSRDIPLDRIEEACKELGLSELLDSLPLRWKTPVNEFNRDLSLGQLQRFKIARALVKDYDIIISDEATCHLPEDQHLEVIRLLNQRSKLHISVLHRVSALQLFDQMIEIDRSGEISVKPTSSVLL